MTFLTPELLDTKTYGFEKLRYLLKSMGIQEGVVDPGDKKVSQRAAGGAAMFVDIAAGRGFIEGDTGTRNGLYHSVNDATVTIAVPASHATLPRVDVVVEEVRDTSDLGSAADDVLPRVISGVATAGATQDNAFDGSHGGPAIPNNCNVLGQLLIPAASTSVVTANIRDRRKWANGVNQELTFDSGDFSNTNTGIGYLSQAFLERRYECSGKPVVVELSALGTHVTAGNNIQAAPLVDGTYMPGIATGLGSRKLFPAFGAGAFIPISGRWEFTPTAGSHLITIGVWTNAGTYTIYCNSGNIAVPRLSVHEDLRSYANNS